MNLGPEVIKQKAIADAKQKQLDDAKSMKALFAANNPTIPNPLTQIGKAKPLVLPSEKSGRGIIVPAPVMTPSSSTPQTKIGALPSLAELNDTNVQPSLADLHRNVAPLATKPETPVETKPVVAIPSVEIPKIADKQAEVVEDASAPAPTVASGYRPGDAVSSPVETPKSFGDTLGSLLKSGGGVAKDVLTAMLKIAQAGAAGASGHPENAYTEIERKQKIVDRDQAAQEARDANQTRLAENQQKIAQASQDFLQNLSQMQFEYQQQKDATDQAIAQQLANQQAQQKTIDKASALNKMYQGFTP